MKFHGAWIHPDDDKVAVTFTAFDETELSPDSQWTEAWQNEDPDAPAGFIHPAMILAETARRLLELKPELADRLKAFEQSAAETLEGREPARELEIRDVEHLGLLCLSLCGPILDRTRRRAPQPTPISDEDESNEIPF